ncbi:leucine-rich repeat domain-containing protein, partial [Bifidobacterium thermophilum]|uniref:leucine-rich repeat domain-containing protein n=1 Tax=Bifidobacterium thermophilum TaxID=33905 RepID=UPI0039926CE0
MPDRSTIAQCFPDKALAQAIASQLKGDKGRTGAVLTSKDVKDTTTLNLDTYIHPEATGISSLQGLQVFTNLKTLLLWGTGVSDVSPLSKLVNLTSLDLSSTGVSDVSPLAKLTKLWYLGLSETRVSDVSPLAKLVNLENLKLDGTRVLDLSPLSKMTNLGWGNGSSRALNVCPSVKLTVNADGSVSMPAPRWLDGTVVAPSSTSPAGGTLDAKRGVVTWKKYDANASYSYDFSNFDLEFSGHVVGVKPTTPSKPTTPGKPTSPTTPSKPAASTVTMFRLYNKYTGEHFYTSSSVERDSLVKVGWRSEGTGWVAPVSGKPVYRLYNPYVPGGDHHYTMST